MAGNAEMIIDLDRKRMTAMGQKDIAALKTMLCNGLVYSRMPSACGLPTSTKTRMAPGGW